MRKPFQIVKGRPQSRFFSPPARVYPAFGAPRGMPHISADTAGPASRHGSRLPGDLARPPAEHLATAAYGLGGAALMSASADAGSRSTARSPSDTMPMGRSSSSTGTRRTALARMSRAT